MPLGLFSLTARIKKEASDTVMYMIPKREAKENDTDDLLYS